MNLILHGKNCTITESMRTYAEDTFAYLSDKSNASIHLTLELMSKEQVQLKASIKYGIQTINVTVIDEDFYLATRDVSRKTKARLIKISKSLKNHDCYSLAESFIQIQEEEISQTEIETKTLPVYDLELEDAISQLESSSENILFFTADGSNVQTLVKNHNGLIQLFLAN